MPTMRTFAETFFKTFGAAVQRQAGELVVDLPPDLAAAFGKPRLYLVFPSPQGEPQDLSPAEDLLVYGSRIFDRMLALLEQRGEAAQLGWPSRLTLDPDHPPLPLPLHNCLVRERQVEIRTGLFFVFNFRVAYVSDEKQEEFLTIVLDAAGRPRPDLLDMLARLEPAQPVEHPLELDPAAWRQLLAQAGDAARRQVEQPAAELEQAIRPRLDKALLRLTTFYRRLLDEVDSGDAAKDEAIRAELQQDLSRKIAGELERHRLQVTLRPLNYAVAHVPLARYRFTLATRHTQQPLELIQNLFTRQVESPACHHCRQPVDHLALCERGHPVHAHCLDTCGQCRRDICLTCGLEACAGCGQPVCNDCTATCAYCERRLCAEHVSQCAICGAAHCTDHAATCRWCGQTYCLRCAPGGECNTCRQALAGPVVAAVSLPAIAGLNPARYRWRQAENNAYRVYFGQRTGLLSPVLNWLIVVTDRSGTVVRRQTMGLMRRFFRRS
ncbi:MAG: hypothetical protein AB1801_04230 [Chloroflexota bacterium]